MCVPKYCTLFTLYEKNDGLMTKWKKREVDGNWYSFILFIHVCSLGPSWFNLELFNKEEQTAFIV